MNDPIISKLPDADMQAAPKAMSLAAQRAREVALQTNTPLVLIRDGVLVEEYVTDPAKPPPIRAKEKAEIAALLARPDSEIDISDIPPLTKKFWKNAVRNPYCKPTKP